MRSVVAITTIAVVLTSIGCCSLARFEDMRERAQRAEKALAESQQFLGGCQEDNAKLQNYGIELENEIRAWQFGAQIMAEREANLRERCDM